MILNDADYAPRRESNRNDLNDQLSDWDILHQEEKNELEQAQQVIRLILQKYDYNENDLELEVVAGGMDWINIDDKVIPAAFFMDL